MSREAYKELFEVINLSNDGSTGTGKTTSLRFLKPSATRWLVRGKVMHNIRVKWDKLLAHFTLAVQSEQS